MKQLSVPLISSIAQIPMEKDSSVRSMAKSEDVKISGIALEISGFSDFLFKNQIPYSGH